MKNIDLLITKGEVILGDPVLRQVRHCDIAIKDGVIVAIGSEQDILKNHAVDTVLDASGCIVFPGLVCTHTHLFQTLLKGLGRDRPLLSWLDSSIRPALKHFDREAVYSGAMLGLAQLASSGVTTVADYQYCHTEPLMDIAVLDAFEDIGMRGLLYSGRTNVLGYPDSIALSYKETEQQYFDQLIELQNLYRNHDRIEIGSGPAIIWDMSKSGYEHLSYLSQSSGLRVSMHCLETEDDDLFSKERYGVSTMQLLKQCNLLSERFLAVHAVHMSDVDFALFKEHSVPVSHCPISNMILASGTAAVPRMLKEGLTVSLAVDGSASNDAQNMFEVMKTATLLQKVLHRDASLLPAEQVLSMATLAGAKALGLDTLTGSIDIGKQADICIYDTKTLYSAPVADVFASLVYSSATESIRQTLVAGNIIYDRGDLPYNDTKQIISAAHEQAQKIRRLSNL